MGMEKMMYGNLLLGLRKRLACTALGIKIGMAYKFEFMIGLLTTPISLFIFYFLWRAIYAYSGVEMIRGYTFDGLVNYFVLSMLVGYFAWSDIDNWLEHMVVNGDMVAEMVRPMQFIAQEMWFDWGLKLISLVTQAIPLVVGAHLLLGLTFVNWMFLLLAIVSTFMAMMIVFLVAYLTGMCAFWFKRISGIRRVRRGVTLLLSGGIVPIAFFPAWFVAVSNYLPFQYMRYVPINVYLGKYSFVAAGFDNIMIVLGVQLAWTILLYIIALLVWKKAFKKFAGAGV
ncbi:ABC-2 family transporter protein [Candidatus Woesearchaeota archaeon]|nr:ABC-2 family transporter protein [Candidatus Woesearchaeota archaeon]